jgi:hypothetical protein
MRVRETRGMSRRGPEPGSRQWQSTTVSYKTHGCLLLPVWALLAVLWVYAEVGLLTVSALAMLIALALRDVRPADVTVVTVRWGLHAVWMR